jgi:hypothetical protein
MRKSKFTESQIVAILAEGEAGLLGSAAGLNSSDEQSVTVKPSAVAVGMKPAGTSALASSANSTKVSAWR